MSFLLESDAVLSIYPLVFFFAADDQQEPSLDHQGWIKPSFHFVFWLMQRQADCKTSREQCLTGTFAGAPISEWLDAIVSSNSELYDLLHRLVSLILPYCCSPNPLFSPPPPVPPMRGARTSV